MNTLENKARFFAQYWFQPVIRFKNKDSDKVFESDVASMTITNQDFDECYLELKPLSSVRDEDKKMIENWRIGFVDKIQSVYSSVIIYIKSASGIETLIADVMTIDYLRSKGYALPWNGITVDEMIEYGWIVLLKASGEKK